MPNGPLTLVARLILLTSLVGCTTGVRAPIVDLSAGAVPLLRPVPVKTVEPAADPVASRADTYLVKPGDTLYGIARATGTSVASLLAWNHIADPTKLRVGQALTLRNPTVVAEIKPAPVMTPKPVPATVSPTSKPAPKSEPKPEPAPPPKPVTTPKPPPVRQADDAKVIQWAWPASGSVIQAFSAASKGIDIAGAPGDPVRAAADGKVMYSGNGVRGLGNLLIINHQNGFITAYAHNRTLLVKTGQEVKRGAKIAELGQTDTTSPRLHFEVRRQGTPVNPLQYLPSR